jgi:CRISPR type I-D-associated protein Csc1
MTNYIGNYAIMYAINTLTNEIHRNASGTNPFYRDDFKSFKLYATPAHPFVKPKVPVTSGSLDWNHWERVSHTFNSVNTLLQTTEYVDKSRPNFPQMGSKEKFTPLNTFEFFVIGGKPPSVIRLGKKHAVCRVHAYPLNFVAKQSGEFSPDHVVNPMDVSDFSKKIIQCDYQLQFPPLALNAKIMAEHYILSDDKSTYYVLKPEPSIYSSVSLP